MSKIAYSYNRYSSPQQSDGDSIRRQTALARGWCARNGYTLDTGTTYEDRGVSGFSGRHRETGMLRRFLDDVEEGHIPRGSVLLIENMDRLSREKPVVGVNVLTGLLLAGVRVVQLAPDEIELTEDADLFTLFRGQMSQARGHDESKTKASRMAAAWDQRQRLARETGARVTARLPAWLEIRGGKLAKTKQGRARIEGGRTVVVPSRVKTVREIFRLAVNGYGLALIVRRLTETVEPWGRSGKWSKAYVRKILTGRAVLGEYQPKKDDEPHGDPIPGYYPAVIDPADWELAQDAMARRKDKPGRVGRKAVALFSGLIWDARTGGKLLVSNQTRGPKGRRSKRRVLVTAGTLEGRETSPSFPVDVFEPAVLSRLKEIDPADVFGGKRGGEVEALSAGLAKVKRSMDAITADLEENGDSPAVLKRLREKEAEHATLTRRLAAARSAERRPKSAAFGEAKTLMDAAGDESARLRLRQLLRESVERVTVLVVARRSDRFAAVRVDFDGGEHRDYLVHYRPARRGSAGGWSVKSFKGAGLGDGLDLRDPRKAKALERVLSAWEAKKT